ncbi:MAG: ribosome recycling factor [Pseudomonadales bacterium]|nr:ribosome-recycling factor [Candidatus Woesebacteria bacterium]MCB9802237.1 ribosome recycling factor [Pseudomonadales bacterium]
MAYTQAAAQAAFENILSHVGQDIATLRTGRATTQMLDPVTVMAYGAPMKLIEVASVSAPDPTLLTVTPWDKALLPDIEKGIATAGLNLNPVVSDDMIRITVTPPTGEQRKELVKQLHQKIESGKVMLRTQRGELKKDIEDTKDDDGVSEDDITTQLEELEGIVKQYTDQLVALSDKKEAELLKL